MTHRFVILVDGELRTYDSIESIPAIIDNVIEFSPHFPEGPHTDEQHHDISQWNDVLKELLTRERKHASSN
jgi:hypothetical protein